MTFAGDDLKYKTVTGYHMSFPLFPVGNFSYSDTHYTYSHVRHFSGFSSEAASMCFFSSLVTAHHQGLDITERQKLLSLSGKQFKLLVGVPPNTGLQGRKGPGEILSQFSDTEQDSS